MRLGLLFLRSRRAGFSITALMAMTVFVGVLHVWSNHVSSHPLTTPNGDPVWSVLVFLPMVIASVISIGTGSPFNELERNISGLPVLRFKHLAVLLLFSIAAVSALGLTWETSGVWVFLRNLVGMAGVSLLSSWMLGARFSWTVPFVYGLVAYAIGKIGSTVPVWAWPMQSLHNEVALAIALALFTIGVFVAVAFGARPVLEEGE